MISNDIGLEEISHVAEQYYREGDFYCPEVIVKAIRDKFGLSLPDSVIVMASGFPVGIGASGCTYGAVAGGIMALGMFFGRTEAKAQTLLPYEAVTAQSIRFLTSSRV